MVDVKKTKREFSKIMMNKKLSSQVFNRGYYLLHTIREENPLFFNVNMGRLLLRKESIEEAKFYLLEALNINPNQASIYYNLYKVNVFEKDYQEAYLNLFEYGKLIGDKGNIQLPLTLLEELIDIDYNFELFNRSDYTISETNYFGIVRVQDMNVLEMLNEIVDNLNNRNYKMATTKLEELNIYIEKNNTPIEVMTIKKLVEEISKKVKQYQIQQLGTNINLLDIIPIEDFEQLLEILLTNKIMTAKILIRKMNSWIENNLEKAKIALKYLAYSKSTPEYHYIINRIAEQEEYLNYSQEEKDNYTSLKDKGRSALKDENYEEALYYFNLGKQTTKNNVFNYYLGKTLYKSGNYSQAKKYLLEYLKDGASKTTKALLYLDRMAKNTGKVKESIKYIKLMKKIEDISYSDFVYINENSPFKIRKSDIDFDVTKFRASKQLRLEASYFQQASERLSLEAYDEYSFFEKTQTIIDLYRHGHNKQADKLLEKLTATTEEEKNQIKQLHKNKKLYKNQKSESPS